MTEQIYVPLSEYLEALDKLAQYRAGFFFAIIFCVIFMGFSLFTLWMVLKGNKTK